MDEKQQEELKAKTKFKALIRNTEKKEITENEIFLEYAESSDEINITIHEIPDFTNTDEQYHDVKIECSGEEDKDEIMQYLTDFWEDNLPFEFFFIPEVPALVKLGEREYLVYTMKTEQEISYSEIAQILEIDESTVRHHYRNAKAKMEEEYNESLEQLKEDLEFYKFYEFDGIKIYVYDSEKKHQGWYHVDEPKFEEIKKLIENNLEEITEGEEEKDYDEIENKRFTAKKQLNNEIRISCVMSDNEKLHFYGISLEELQEDLSQEQLDDLENDQLIDVDEETYLKFYRK